MQVADIDGGACGRLSFCATMLPMERIAIIGGGAAGLAAAVGALEAARASGRVVSVRVFEESDRVGRPILATGNGRCNFTNASIDASCYRNAAFVADALEAFERAYPKAAHPNGVAAFFAQHGMLYREEGEGRLYPLANKASVVLDVLRDAVRTVGGESSFEPCLAAHVSEVDMPSGAGRFTLRMRDGVLERADAVVVACGGRIAADLLPEAFAFEPQRPVLCSLAAGPADVRELDNIRAKAALTLLRDERAVACERGEVMFRKYGLSGICTFNLSRLARPGDELSVDFLPFVAEADVRDFAEGRLSQLEKVRLGAVDCEGFLRGMVLPRVADVLLGRMGMNADGVVDCGCAARLVCALKDFRFQVEGPGDVEHAQVRRGGLRVEGFRPQTLESIAQPGLHVVGEALDVDGPCGGYNLHWAFATGLMAGRACAS